MNDNSRIIKYLTEQLHYRGVRDHMNDNCHDVVLIDGVGRFISYAELYELLRKNPEAELRLTDFYESGFNVGADAGRFKNAILEGYLGAPRSA